MRLENVSDFCYSFCSLNQFASRWQQVSAIMNESLNRSINQSFSSKALIHSGAVTFTVAY